jgi:Cof subfamily protein (haloacid dehalogenase superfamily)
MTSIKYTVAAVDMDDTLLRSDGTISPYTLAVLHRWQEAGRRLVIATGRPQRTIHPSLPAALHHLPIICYNGAEIHIDGQRVHEILIPPDAVRLIVEQLLQVAPECTVGLEVAGELYLNRAMDRPTPYQVADLLEIAARPAAKVLIFGERPPALDPLLASLPATARALHSARYNHFVQILAAGANKAAALAVLMEQWGVPLRQVVAFGDDTNDIEMLLECGLGVAMDNAAEEVKAVADEITATNDEDGVALTLARLLDSGISAS